jgi:colanic acid biosynthesis glycosyl transferase WcaI
MKIWIITNLYLPDVHGGAVLYADMAAWLRSRGHDVRVTTTFPYYPEWKLRKEDHGKSLREEIWEGVPLRRLAMYVPSRPNAIRRLLSDASFFWALVRRGAFQNWTPDAVITAEPMLSQCLALRFLPPWYAPARRLIIVQDFVADAAIELGMLKHPLLKIAARTLERWALRSADIITTISPGMLNKLHHVLQLPMPGESAHIIGCLLRNPQAPATAYLPNWIHGSLFSAATVRMPAAPLRKNRTLLYSGNLGMKQGLPDFVRSFCAFDHDWTLLIHGAGAGMDELQKLVGEQADARVQLGGILDEEAYLNLLFSVSACVITQKSGVGANFLPSKLLPCLATATPVLAVADADSPLAREIITSHIGQLVDSNTKEALAEALRKLASTPAEYFRSALLKRRDIYTDEATLGKIESWMSMNIIQETMI